VNISKKYTKKSITSCGIKGGGKLSRKNFRIGLYGTVYAEGFKGELVWGQKGKEC